MKTWFAVGMMLINALLVSAGENQPVAAEQYAAVKTAAFRTLQAIKEDFAKQKSTYPQLAKLDDLKLSRIPEDDPTYAMLYYQNGATWKAPQSLVEHTTGGTFEIADGGCRISISFLLYDAGSDPRVAGVALAAPPDHFLSKKHNAPYGITLEIDADSTAAGRAFQKAVRELVEKRLAAHHAKLEATAIDYLSLHKEGDKRRGQ